MTRAAHKTRAGAYYIGRAEQLLVGEFGRSLAGGVQLLLTSPPFPLNNKKSYGNLTGERYRNWFINLAKLFSRMLSSQGSIVIEIGNAWEAGRPVQSLLPLECLLGFVTNERAGLRLCQQLVCYNPARLPTPAQWVTVKRNRLTDSYTNIWWMAKDDEPKADNRRVVRPYSSSMKGLLERQTYNTGRRPSEHNISKHGFLRKHRGSIQPNLFEMEPIQGVHPVRLPNVMRIANTDSNSFYLRACRQHGINPHPARMAPELAAFFIEFLTDPGDLVLDPFAGSNTTGFIAEMLGRRWISIDASDDYVQHSRLRFADPALHPARSRSK